MSEVKEVYEMVTKQKPPEPGALGRQWDRQRRAARNRKAGVIALVAVLLVGLGALVIVRDSEKNGMPATGNSPSVTGPALSIIDIGTGGTTAFTAPISTSGFDLAPDGSMFTYTDFDEDGNDQVFVMDTDGSNRSQLTHTPGGVTRMECPPQWSPDGSAIAYWATEPGADHVELFTVRLSDGVSTRITHESNDVYEGGWASDRSFVFSISNQRSDYPLLARSVDVGTGETRTISRDVSAPEVSPDGTQIAFDSYFRPEGEAWLSVMNIDGTGRQKLHRANYSTGGLPRWSPDGTKIAFIGDSGEVGPGTYVYDLTTGKTRFVTTGTTESWIDDDHILVS